MSVAENLEVVVKETRWKLPIGPWGELLGSTCHVGVGVSAVVRRDALCEPVRNVGRDVCDKGWWGRGEILSEAGGNGRSLSDSAFQSKAGPDTGCVWSNVVAAYEGEGVGTGCVKGVAMHCGPC